MFFEYQNESLRYRNFQGKKKQTKTKKTNPKNQTNKKIKNDPQNPTHI